MCFSNLIWSFDAIYQKPVSRYSHEIGIAMNVVTLIHHWHHILKKALNFLNRTLGLELCDPDRPAVCDFTGCSNVGLEYLDGSSAIPIDSAKVERNTILDNIPVDTDKVDSAPSTML